MASDIVSIEKCDIVARSLSDSEPGLPSVETVSTLQKVMKKSTTKVKAAIATAVAIQERTEAELLGNLSVDHPYLSVLYKRIRSHRKKLEKIKSLELAQQNEGKVLNAQQLDLMSNKATFKKLVAELEMLREQFIGVFSEELEQKKLQEADDKTVGADEQRGKENNQQTNDTESVALVPDQVEIQNDKEHIEKETDFTAVYELLKTLHVVNLHQALGKAVPLVLDFFSKVLLGKTRPPAELSYDENLMESFEEAQKYLLDSDKTFACDTKYSGLKALVNAMATSLADQAMVDDKADTDAKLPEQEIQKTMINEPLDVPVVPAEIDTMPQISFFTESQLEAEQADKGEPSKDIGSYHVAVEVQDESVGETCTNHETETKEEQGAPSLITESIAAPLLSFAAVAAGAISERTPAPSALSSDKDKEPRGNISPQKSARRRGQGRWREKSSSTSGNKTGGSPTDRGKPRPRRVPRSSDDSISAQGGKRNGSRDEKHPRLDRGLQKGGNSTQQATTYLIAPHA